MLINWVGYRSGLRDAVEAVWPEITAAGGGFIWTRAAIERVALEDLTTDPDSDGTTAIIQPTTPTFSDEWSGLTNQAYLIETLFHYVRRRPNTAEDMEELVEGKLQQLAERLLYTRLSIGQVVRVNEIDATEGNLINSILLDKNKAFYGGTLSASLLVGHGRS
jgi:hypothetical protein